MFWDIFMDPFTGEDLVFDGVIEDGFWVNGVLRGSVSGVEYPVIDGVVVFAWGVDTGWSDEDVEALRRDRWIERNWEEHMSNVGKGGLWIASAKRLLVAAA